MSKISVGRVLYKECICIITQKGMEDDLPYGRQMRVYHKVGISRRKRKITTKMEGRFPNEVIMLPSCSRSKNFAKGVLDHIVGRLGRQWLGGRLSIRTNMVPYHSDN
ncbi:hypothetical protein OUZ56_016559 [Daphnia magna]|uniref:Uncharacterized protein n=1 Tax=Daphnia magna TaxID=35525 RepID=A0ABR0AQW4_9CRUS|nr:hypothetical protein OUZ56_016559 [Daphnia magna]